MSATPTLSRCSQARTLNFRRTSNAVRPFRTARIPIRVLPEQGEDISEALKADLERLRAKSASGAAGGPSGTAQQPPKAEEAAGPLPGQFKDALDKLLIADFFLVLFILAWLAGGVLQNALNGGSGSPLLDAWYPLWPLLWQPALGVLMAGALVSGGLGWLREQQQQRQ
ncbi:hypothetical protein VOLCADRAFT_77268 [Volvox carteri f. nagariensis]|uniref:Uncharacterized protein n=1 Tax=Volvox carteri f. nagariensis TaxID=3068 RepID=D8UDU9_VOLCA|nr:uncharacterized protein VOLCADRAFT_77268 [Volvox carteri f. nagariensis]EFJ42107.1 hypothetical protein VOLCADRAFT_77268 [Volvox carteri f. nagariensis]|eukprot:XP_002956804.1 hypothetical protein VOLCADRAFT_77268 [Volvox carteri f. nagariensis]